MARPDAFGRPEGPANRLLGLLIGPLGHALIKLRNAETLRRLKELAESRDGRCFQPG